VWRKHSRKEINWIRRDGGILTYITCQKRVQRAASLKTSHFVDQEGIHEASPVRKRVCPPLLNVHMIQTPEHD
jgi:hypothetical protein